MAGNGESLANRFPRDFNSTDVIAVIVIIGGFILMALNIDTVVGGVITMTAGFYFGSKSGRR